MLAVCVAVFATVAVGNQDESDALLSARVRAKQLPETHGASVETHSYIPDSELLPKIEEVLDLKLEPKIREVLETMTDEFKGETGDTGDSGVDGTHGNHGNDGEKGEKGDSGVNGNHGTDGQDGAQGDQGDQGDDGVDGEKGETGESGVNGNHGTDGQNGAKGDKGDQGNDGVDGENGEKGDSGVNGNHGTNGQNGAKGAKGDKGDKGDKHSTYSMTVVSLDHGGKSTGIYFNARYVSGMNKYVVAWLSNSRAQVKPIVNQCRGGVLQWSGRIELWKPGTWKSGISLGRRQSKADGSSDPALPGQWRVGDVIQDGTC